MTEHQLQCACVKWARLNRGRYPGLERLFAIPNGGNRSAATGAKMKSEGVRRGVPDLFLPVVTAHHGGLWIEMKTGSGRLSEEQVGWRDYLTGAGYAWGLCRSLDEFIGAVVGYLHPPQRTSSPSLTPAST